MKHKLPVGPFWVREFALTLAGLRWRQVEHEESDNTTRRIPEAFVPFVPKVTQFLRSEHGDMKLAKASDDLCKFLNWQQLLCEYVDVVEPDVLRKRDDSVLGGNVRAVHDRLELQRLFSARPKVAIQE